jgi:hypothetical protein
VRLCALCTAHCACTLAAHLRLCLCACVLACLCLRSVGVLSAICDCALCLWGVSRGVVFRFRCRSSWIPIALLYSAYRRLHIHSVYTAAQQRHPLLGSRPPASRGPWVRVRTPHTTHTQTHAGHYTTIYPIQSHTAHPCSGAYFSFYIRSPEPELGMGGYGGIWIWGIQRDTMQRDRVGYGEISGGIQWDTAVYSGIQQDTRKIYSRARVSTQHTAGRYTHIPRTSLL